MVSTPIGPKSVTRFLRQNRRAPAASSRREGQRDLGDAHARDLGAVDRGDRHVHHPRVEGVHADEHVVLEEVVVGDLVQIEQLEKGRARHVKPHCESSMCQ